MPSLRRGLADRFDIFHRMRERDGLKLRHRRLFARQRGKLLVLQRRLDGAQPVRPLRMAGRGQVIEAGGMRDEKRAHERKSFGISRRWDMGGRHKST